MMIPRPTGPALHAVHTDPGAVAGECVSIPKSLAEKPVKQKSAAEWAYQRLVLYIQNFEKQLDNEHEVAMGFVGGDAGVLKIEGMGFFDPDIVTFYGRDGMGTRTQLIQHVSQLNVFLRALPIPREAEAPARIGFRLAADLDDAETAPAEDTDGG